MPQFFKEQTSLYLNTWGVVYGLPLIPFSTPVFIFPLKKGIIFLISSSQAKKRSLLIFEILFPMFLFFTFIQENQKRRVVTTKNKTGNPTFVHEEDIPMVHEDYDEYNTPNTNRIDETSFVEPDTTEGTSTIRLRQKVKRNKITALYRHQIVTGSLELINLGRFRLTTDPRKGTTIFEFYNGDR